MRDELASLRICLGRIVDTVENARGLLSLLLTWKPDKVLQSVSHLPQMINTKFVDDN